MNHQLNVSHVASKKVFCESYCKNVRRSRRGLAAKNQRATTRKRRFQKGRPTCQLPHVKEQAPFSDAQMWVCEKERRDENVCVRARERERRQNTFLATGRTNITITISPSSILTAESLRLYIPPKVCLASVIQQTEISALGKK